MEAQNDGRVFLVHAYTVYVSVQNTLKSQFPHLFFLKTFSTLSVVTLLLGNAFMYRGARYIPGKVLEKRVAKARSLSNPFSFSPLKHGKRDIENITCSVFRVFNAGKPIGLDSDLANVIRRSKAYLGIYRSSPCLKAVTSYKVTTKHVENGTLGLFTYISQTLSCTVEIGITLESFQTGG